MLYLIGGPARSGKTTASLRLHAEEHFSFFPLDALVMGVINGMPELGVTGETSVEEIARGTWPLTRAILASLVGIPLNYVVEGETLTPEGAVELAERYPGRVKAVFLGYPGLTAEEKFRICRRHADERSDWTSDTPDGALLSFLGRCVEDSRAFRGRCVAAGIPFFDSSTDYDGAVRAAVRSLLEGPPLR